MSDVLELENITRRYREGEGQLEVFSGLTMSLKPGEIVALVGPSGAGKSSLLHIAGLLEAPTSGEIYHRGRGDLEAATTANAPASAARPSALSIRPITCCRNSMRWRMWCCRR